MFVSFLLNRLLNIFLTHYEVSGYLSFYTSELFSFDISKLNLFVEMDIPHSQADHQMIDSLQKTS